MCFYTGFPRSYVRLPKGRYIRKKATPTTLSPQSCRRSNRQGICWKGCLQQMNPSNPTLSIAFSTGFIPAFQLEHLIFHLSAEVLGSDRSSKILHSE